MPSESGINAMRFSSMTCPAEPLRVSSSGASAATETVSSKLPTSRVSGELETVADSDLDTFARRLLEAGELDGDLVRAWREVGNRVSAVAVGGRRRHDVGGDVRHRDGDTWKPATLWIGDAPGDGASEVLCVSVWARQRTERAQARRDSHTVAWFLPPSESFNGTDTAACRRPEA